MAFNRLTREQDNAGLKVLEQLGVRERDWIRMTKDPELANRVAAQFLLPLLEPLYPVVLIPSLRKSFVVQDHFEFGAGSDTELPISSMGAIFRRLINEAQIELSSGEINLRPWRLQRAEKNGPIIAALGGMEKAQTSFWEIFNYLKSADQTRRSILYKDGYTVDASWLVDRLGGWDLRASPIKFPDKWHTDCLIVAREVS